VEIHLYRPIDKCKRFEGELTGFEDGQVAISTAAGEMRFALKDISLCKPVIVITEEDLEDGGDGDDAMDEEGVATDGREE